MLPRVHITSGLLIKVIGAYACCVLGLISFLVLSSGEVDVHGKAIIKMALGLNLLWCVVAGKLLYRFREPIGRGVRRIPVHWRVKFILFATILALLEEVITVSMTNLAPFFGSSVGKAFWQAPAFRSSPYESFRVSFLRILAALHGRLWSRA